MSKLVDKIDSWHRILLGSLGLDSRHLVWAVCL